MNRTRVWYIPGWASGRSGDCELLRLLQELFEVEVVWLPEYADQEWTPDLPADLLYGPSLLKKLDGEPEPIAIIGWSTGGMAALEVAAARPSLVNALALLSSTARFCADENGIGSSIDDLDRLRAELAAAPERALRRFFLTCYNPHRPTAASLDASIGAALDASPEQLEIGLKYLRNSDLRLSLARITAPALVLHGEQDTVVPVEAGRELWSRLPGAQMHTFIGTGHMLPACSAAEILPLITNLLGSSPNPNT